MRPSAGLDFSAVACALSALALSASASAQSQPPPVDQKAELNKQVGVLIADGHCDDAKKLALRHGDLELAKQVKDYCAPRPMSLGSWWRR